MKSDQPLTQIEMIERSLRCFAFGLLGLLPVIGIPMAIYASSEYRHVKRGLADRWNPAQRYAFWGALCARLGLALFLVIPVVVILIGVLGFGLNP
jgi:hypothetical protein